MAANSVDVRVLLFAADVGVRRVSQQVHQEGAHQWLDTRHLCALHQWVRVFPYMILIHCEKTMLPLFSYTFSEYFYELLRIDAFFYFPPSLLLKNNNKKPTYTK